MKLERPSRRTTVTLLVVVVVSLLLDFAFGAFRLVRVDGGGVHATETVSLPSPNRDSDTSLEAAIASRRSRRTYGTASLSRQELGQLLWAAQGVTRHVSG